MVVLEAEAIAVDPVHVFVICPHCGKVHLHGSCCDINGIDYGSRAPHCNYRGDYIIIASERTVRSETPIDGSKEAMRLYRRQLQ